MAKYKFQWSPRQQSTKEASRKTVFEFGLWTEIAAIANRWTQTWPLEMMISGEAMLTRSTMANAKEKTHHHLNISEIPSKELKMTKEKQKYSSKYSSNTSYLGLIRLKIFDFPPEFGIWLPRACWPRSGVGRGDYIVAFDFTAHQHFFL